MIPEFGDVVLFVTYDYINSTPILQVGKCTHVSDGTTKENWFYVKLFQTPTHPKSTGYWGMRIRVLEILPKHIRSLAEAEELYPEHFI